MTRRDFEFIAATIRETREALDVRDPSGVAVCDMLARDFARKLAIGNPLFNTARFLAACGLEA